MLTTQLLNIHPYQMFKGHDKLMSKKLEMIIHYMLSTPINSHTLISGKLISDKDYVNNFNLNQLLYFAKSFSVVASNDPLYHEDITVYDDGFKINAVHNWFNIHENHNIPRRRYLYPWIYDLKHFLNNPRFYACEPVPWSHPISMNDIKSSLKNRAA